jgi:uncharacterized iron-regulated protein
MRLAMATAAALGLLTGPMMVAAAQELPRADVVILGEVHDNPAHHLWQVEQVAAVAPAALVFEMLLPEQAAVVTPELRGDAAALGAALGWEERGWPDFAMYHPIFAASPDAAVFGGDLPHEEVRRAVEDGAAAVFGPEAVRFGLDRPLPEAEQAAREALQAAAHCGALPEALLPGMVEAQRLRDAALARAVVEAHAATGGPVVLIAGSGHARTDWGVPAVLAEAAPELSVFSVGQLEGEADAPFDLLRLTEAVQRPDPCAAFR